MSKFRLAIWAGILFMSILVSGLLLLNNEWVLIETPSLHGSSRLCETCYQVHRNSSDHGELRPDMNFIHVDEISRDLLGERFEDVLSTLTIINDKINQVDEMSLLELLLQSQQDYEGHTYIPGGHWKPKNTTDKSKVALLVPFRNRERTIGIFLRHMIPFILRQRLEFGIFVIEQTDSLKFNRAMLMNVGFLEALKFEEWDCIIIHDVDFIPHYDDNSYTCHNMPRHFLSGLAKRPKVKNFEFNGVTGFTVRQYRLMNGAPNRYWGWGGEDHDLRTRAELQKWKIYRTNHPYGFYDHIPHKVHTRNETEDNWPQFNKEVAEWQFRDGLNNIQYSQPEVTILPLFVKIEVALSELKIKADHPRSKKKT